MSDLIAPEELPRWVPGEIMARSDGLGWRGVALRSYRYLGQDVYIPPMRDYMVVSYKRGDTPMERRFDGSWTQTRCAPGSVSLLTRAQRSDWNWSQNVDVSHVYLTGELLNKLASEALGRSVTDVRLRDVLNVDDAVITATVGAIQAEAAQQAVGGALYVEALATQLGLHLLRRYSSVTFREAVDASGLSAAQRRHVVDYIESHLDAGIDLDALAAVTGLGVCSFNRRFRKTFGCAPYSYVIDRRVARARELVEAGELPLKQIAPACGFNDQAHMTRLFRARLGVTPGALRGGKRGEQGQLS